MTGASTMKAARSIATLVALATILTAAACGKKTPPVARPMPPPPPPAETAPPSPPAPPEPAREPVSVPPDPVRDDAISSASLDELNKNSPLKPVYFELDSSDLSAANQRTLDEDAALIKRYSTWTVTIEGHCDERGSAEYNLALGERRAMAARTYLVSLGIAATRLRTVSYGKEFPFDPGHDEAAFAKNRRAHFVITAK
ncbi:MAG TPA: peptidoglycan-associated lipoprotein Pal [Gemmatimonadaceae bacterium]|jgi:peptidoglycan-associated lipoprotein|nr:peptidoglycan-associated lipoprotein Pal [Gemmatimonadaceae bacterium]